VSAAARAQIVVLRLARHAETATAERRRLLAAKVQQVFEKSRKTYGCRRITAALNRDGHRCSVGLPSACMQRLCS